MVDLFLDRVLVENNWDQDELNTEREITGIDPRKPHPHVVLRFGRLWQVSGVCACPERLFQEVKGPGLRRIPKTAGSHLYKVFVIFNSMPGVIHKVYISMYVLQH